LSGLHAIAATKLPVFRQQGFLKEEEERVNSWCKNMNSSQISNNEQGIMNIEIKNQKDSVNL
jgi:hypothetical protein